MKRRVFLFAWSLAMPVVAEADSFSDFRIPDHSTRSGNVELQASGRWAHAGIPGLDTDDSVLGSHLLSGVGFVHESDALLVQGSGLLKGDASHGVTRSHQVSPGAESRNDQRGEDFLEQWNLFASGRAYPWQLPLGFEASAFGAGYYTQVWWHQEMSSSISVPAATRSEGLGSDERHASRHQASFQLAVGWGRVRNATVVFDVQLLVDRLQATGALARPLTSAAKSQLARLYYIASDFHAVHDRPDRWFWREVERILKEDGAVAGEAIDAYSLYRAAEPYGPRLPSISESGAALQDIPFTRYRGWFVGPLARGTTIHQEMEEEQTNEARQFAGDSLVAESIARIDSRWAFSYDAFHLGGRVEYHLPIGWRWQLDASSWLTVPVRHDEHGLDAFTSATLGWLIADRWRADITFNHRRSIFEPRGTDALQVDAWDVRFTSNLAYYLEDRTEMFAQVDQVQAKNRSQYDGKRYNRDTTVLLGVRYRFLGAADAPGLIEPQRILAQ